MAKILIAEDDPHIGRVIMLWLQRSGHEVIRAASGDKALELIRQHRPDLLVTDVNMPGIDGLELLARVRTEGLVRRQAIVLTSRCDQADIESRAVEFGAVVHPKPFSPNQLIADIEKALLATLNDAGRSMVETGSSGGSLHG